LFEYINYFIKIMKKYTATFNDLTNYDVSYSSPDAFFELQSPRLIEKSGADSPYLFDKLVEEMSLDLEASGYTDREFTPRASSVMDRSTRKAIHKIQPDKAIILYKIINPDEIISRCKSRQIESQIKSKKITPRSSITSLGKRSIPHSSKSPVILERKSSKLLRNSSSKRLSSRSPMWGDDKSIAMVDSSKVTNYTPEPIRTSIQIASITKNRLKLLRPRESSKENSTVNRTFNCLPYESNRASLVRQKEQNSIKLINLLNPHKSNSVKSISAKMKDASITSRAHSPIKLLYSKSSKHAVTKKYP
jgi:hypothetical protein